MGETDGQGGWLTYSEAAEVLGSTAEAVRRRARRYNWPRLRPNLPGEHARVRVLETPGTARERPPAPDEHSTLPDGQMPAVSAGTTQVSTDSARAFELAIEALHEQLVGERRRVDELLASLAEERRQIDRLHLDLADAVTAERIAAGEAAALRTIVTGLRERPWWRRLVPVRPHTAPRTGAARKQHALVPYIADRGSLALCGRRFVTGVLFERFDRFAADDSRNLCRGCWARRRLMRC